MAEYSSSVKLLGILTTPPYYDRATQPQPLAKTAYKQKFDTVTAMLFHFNS